MNKFAEILRSPKFNILHKTVLYLHGYVESPASPTVQETVKAYIKRGSYNILVLDWSTLVNGSYITAVTNAIEVRYIRRIRINAMKILVKNKFMICSISLGKGKERGRYNVLLLVLQRIYSDKIFIIDINSIGKIGQLSNILNILWISGWADNLQSAYQQFLQRYQSAYFSYCWA